MKEDSICEGQTYIDTLTCTNEYYCNNYHNNNSTRETYVEQDILLYT